MVVLVLQRSIPDECAMEQFVVRIILIGVYKTLKFKKNIYYVLKNQKIRFNHCFHNCFLRSGRK